MELFDGMTTTAIIKQRWWMVLPLIGVFAIVYWFRSGDETTVLDRRPLVPTVKPAPDAQPVVRTSGPLSQFLEGMLAKPVVASDRDGRIVVVAMHGSPSRTTMELVQWRSTDGGQSWPQPTALKNWPDGCDLLADPWLQTDHRNRFHLAHLATSLKNRNFMPVVYRRSLDGGETWQSPKQLAEGDRPVLAISPNGRQVVVVCLMGDPTATQLKLAEISDSDASRKARAMNRVMTPGVFHSSDRGVTWKRLPGPTRIRHAVALSAVIDDAGRIAAGWVANDGKGSQSVVCATSNVGAT